MFKKLIPVCLSVSLTFSAICLPIKAEASIVSETSFSDTSHHWAIKVAEEANAMGLLTGYPNGTFLPEKMMTRLEAISVIIRSMGLEEEALALKPSESELTLPNGMSWGQGFLIMAAEKGLLNKNYLSVLKYNEAISRAEVATLIAIALDLTGDSSTLSFSDTSSITEMYQPYIAGVVQTGIMQGLGNNQFGPSQGMKRGQMAALVTKLANEEFFNNNVAKARKSIITSVEPESGLISFINIDGTTTTAVLNENLAIFNGDSLGSINDVKVGASVITAPINSSIIKYLEITDSIDVNIPNDSNSENNISDPDITDSIIPGDGNVSEKPTEDKNKTPEENPIKEPVEEDNAIEFTNTSSTIMDGTIIEVDYVNERIKIKNTAGTIYWIYLAQDCTFYDDVDNFVNNLNKLKVNWQVEMLINNAQITELAVTVK